VRFEYLGSEYGPPTPTKALMLLPLICVTQFLAVGASVTATPSLFEQKVHCQTGKTYWSMVYEAKAVHLKDSAVHRPASHLVCAASSPVGTIRLLASKLIRPPIIGRVIFYFKVIGPQASSPIMPTTRTSPPAFSAV